MSRAVRRKAGGIFFRRCANSGKIVGACKAVPLPPRPSPRGEGSDGSTGGDCLGNRYKRKEKRKKKGEKGLDFSANADYNGIDGDKR